VAKELELRGGSVQKRTPKKLCGPPKNQKGQNGQGKYKGRGTKKNPLRKHKRPTNCSGKMGDKRTRQSSDEDYLQGKKRLSEPLAERRPRKPTTRKTTKNLPVRGSWDDIKKRGTQRGGINENSRTKGKGKKAN